MTGKSLKYLSDILMAIALIEDFTKEISDYTSYENDKKNSKCYACQKQTFGVFNIAHKLNKKLALKDKSSKDTSLIEKANTRRGTWE